MRYASALAGAFMLFGLATAATPSLAGPVAAKVPHAGSGVLNVADWDGPRRDRRWRDDRFDDRRFDDHDGFRHRRWRRCGYWRHECADRWGWRSFRFERCLARHGC